MRSCARTARLAPSAALYTEQLLNFESRLERALRVDMPPDGRCAAVCAQAPRTRRARRDAGWRSRPAFCSASAIVGGHLAHLAAIQPCRRRGRAHGGRARSLAAHRRRGADAELDDVLKDSKLRLKPDAGIVSYASSCTFRGHRVPHLVVQTPSGPVTVMVLVHESVRQPDAIRRTRLSRNHRARAGPRQHRRAHARSRHRRRCEICSASPRASTIRSSGRAEPVLAAPRSRPRSAGR